MSLLGSVLAGAAGGAGKGMAEIGRVGVNKKARIDIATEIGKMEEERSKRLADYQAGISSKAAAATRNRASAYQQALGERFEALRAGATEATPSDGQAADMTGKPAPATPGSPVSDRQAALETIKWGRANGVPEASLAPYTAIAYPEAKVVGAGGQLVETGSEGGLIHTNPNKSPEEAAAMIALKGDQTRRTQAEADRRRADREAAAERSGREVKGVEAQIDTLTREVEDRYEEIQELRDQRGVYGEKKKQRDATIARLQGEIRRRESERQRLSKSIDREAPPLDVTTPKGPATLDPAVESLLKRHLPQ